MARVPPRSNFDGANRGQRRQPPADAERAARLRNQRAAALTRGRKKSSLAGPLAKAALLVFALAGFFLLFGASGVGALAAAYSFYSRDLPSPDRVVNRETFKTAVIYDRNGEQLYEFWDPNAGKRTVVPLDEMSPHVLNATLATEDPNFYENPGIDLRGIARAFWQNLRSQEIQSGASTITQQLIRQTVLDPEERFEASYSRKLKEAVLAYQLSQRYSKDEILQMYLNEINYGNLSYGIQAAAESYFGKSARELNLAEAAMLAGIPAAPYDYNPLRNPQLAKKRQGVVLDLMVRHGFATEDEVEAAKEARLLYALQQTEIKAPHFVMYVRELLEQRYGRQKIFSSGLRVYTTIDLRLQALAEKVAAEHIATLADHNAHNAAMVAMDSRTGEILAMLGSVDYHDVSIDGQINMALAERQPGSTLKPFTYITAFTKGLAPASILMDQPTEFSGGQGQPAFKPNNHDGVFKGPISVRKALGGSRNIPAVLTLQQIGVQTLIDVLHEAGITSLNERGRYGLALTLGGGEVKLLDLTFAYSSLANGGVQVGQPVPLKDRQPGQRAFEPVALLKVTDADGNVIDEYVPPEGKRLFSPQHTFLITDILADDDARADTFGRNSYLVLDRPAAVKTGTTDDYRDAWTIGFTPDFVTGVWVGNANNKPMKDLLAVRAAGVIWNKFMTEALKGVPPKPFERPPGVVRATVSAKTGLRPAPGEPTVTDWFVEGSVPTSWGIAPTTPSPVVTPSPLPALATVTPATKATTPTPMQARPPTPTPMQARPPTPTPMQARPPTPTPVSDQVAMPNVIGLTEEEGRRRIQQAGLNTGYVNYQSLKDVSPKNRDYFLKFQPGQIVSQNPAPGSTLKRGASVLIAVRKE